MAYLCMSLIPGVNIEYKITIISNCWILYCVMMTNRTNLPVTKGFPCMQDIQY